MTAQDEAEDLVDGVVDDYRTQIKERHEEIIDKAVSRLKNQPYREMNVFFSEVRRQVEKQKK